MHVPTFIERKRDGGELSAAEIEEFIRGYTRGEIPDYQASAWAMAVFFRGMTAAETGALTRAMMHSGRVLELSRRLAAEGRQTLDRRHRRQDSRSSSRRCSRATNCGCR